MTREEMKRRTKAYANRIVKLCSGFLVWMPRCGVPARVQRVERLWLLPFAPLHAARSSQRDDPTSKIN